MKFGNYFENNQISEWTEFYINFKLLKKYLKPLEKNYREQIKSSVLISSKSKKITSLNIKGDEDLEEGLLKGKNSLLLTKQESEHHQSKFQEQILRELKKVEFFLIQNSKYYKTRLGKIRDQLEFVKKNKVYKIYKDVLEKALMNLYKELFLMRDFIELNLKAQSKITKKFRKVTKILDTEIKINLESNLNEFLTNSKFMNDPMKSINEIIAETEKTFYNHFFDTYSVSTLRKLKDFVSSTVFTLSQAFYFGFFMGLLLVCSILCIFIARNFNIDMDNDEEFSLIIPMFRAFGIVCLYKWLLGLNVWAWNYAHIDYKLSFQFSNHFSDVISIFSRAAIFSSIFVLMLLCYLIIRSKIPLSNELLDFIPLNMTPLICWICLLVYLFFPSKNHFNFQGRLYLFNLCCDSVVSIFVKTEFKHVWFMDQLTSLIGPMRDMEYTLCYYVNYDNTELVRKELCNNKRSIVLFIGIIPHFIRILQCMRIIYDTNSFFPQILNVGKYFFAIILGLLSYLLLLSDEFRPYWWICAIISTVYSSWWDLKYDFGFLESGKNWPFREKLAYKNQFIYYFALVSNLFLRFMWVLSISPQIVYQYILPEFFSLLIYSLEAIRRGIWNFIRVELHHIQLCKEFKVTVEVELPFKKVNDEFVLKKVEFEDILKINNKVGRVRSMSDDKKPFDEFDEKILDNMFDFKKKGKLNYFYF